MDDSDFLYDERRKISRDLSSIAKEKGARHMSWASRSQNQWLAEFSSASRLVQVPITPDEIRAYHKEQTAKELVDNRVRAALADAQSR